MEWFTANWDIAATALAIVMINVGIALTRYPRTGEWTFWLKCLGNLLAVLSHRNSPGYFKFPFVLSPQPEQPVATEKKESSNGVQDQEAS